MEDGAAARRWKAAAREYRRRELKLAREVSTLEVQLAKHKHGAHVVRLRNKLDLVKMDEEDYRDLRRLERLAPGLASRARDLLAAVDAGARDLAQRHSDWLASAALDIERMVAARLERTLATWRAK